MRNKFFAILGAAVIGAAATAHAAYELQFTQLEASALNATLTANGWTGFIVKIVGTDGDLVDGFEAHVSMPLHQAWAGDTLASVEPSLWRATMPTTVASTRDSFFFNTPRGASIAGTGIELLVTEIAEDNAGSGSPLNNIAGDPDEGIPATLFGVGTSMDVAAAYNEKFESINLAFLITRDGGEDAQWIDANLFDADIHQFLGKIDVDVIDANEERVSMSSFYVIVSEPPLPPDPPDQPDIPEPASLSLLGLGAVALLARRRR